MWRALARYRDRLQFICRWLFLLGPSTWTDPEPDHVESACAVLLNKLEEELEPLRAVLDQSLGVSLGEHEDLP